MAVINCTVDRSSWYKMYIEYSISTSTANKQSTISHALKIEQLTDSYDFDGNMNVTYYVAGSAYSYNGNIDMDDKGNKGYTITIKSGSTTINHDTTTGDASFTVSCSGTCNSGGWGPGNISLSSTTIKCSRIPLYTLSMSAGTGSSITVNRTSSGGSGGTGNLSAGSNKLYYGDKLKISFTASTNYGITKHTVNGSSFTSGNTHTVSGNVSVISTATPLKSEVGATDANIGSASTISVTRYNSSYTHTLTYSFGSLTGTIATKSSNTSIAWTVPTTFYAQIPNAKTGTCTITCTTYNGSTSLGSTSCTITVTASSSECKPSVAGTVVDTNSTTLALTGGTDSNTILIRYKSTAKCTITATAKNSATISSKTINDYAPTDNVKTFTGVSATSFVFKTTDSRGYSNSATVSPTVVNYIQLTCNPIITRPTPTGSSIVLDVSGSWYKGSFGAKSNTLTMEYRYAASGGSYSAWQTVDTTKIIKGTTTYRSDGSISLGEDFDYHLDYDFQVRVKDGADGYVLSTVTKTVPVSRGIPICDWGENDFNFNVPIMLNNVNILNIMYPVGAVYMHSGSTLPTAIGNIGSWSSVTTGISGVYAWKRTA